MTKSDVLKILILASKQDYAKGLKIKFKNGKELKFNGFQPTEKDVTLIDSNGNKLIKIFFENCHTIISISKCKG